MKLPDETITLMEGRAMALLLGLVRFCADRLFCPKLAQSDCAGRDDEGR
jgi:hypothetical protein